MKHIIEQQKERARAEIKFNATTTEESSFLRKNINIYVAQEIVDSRITSAATLAYRQALLDVMLATLSDLNMSDELRVAHLKVFIQLNLPDYKSYLNPVRTQIEGLLGKIE
jgi:hypothetical protein